MKAKPPETAEEIRRALAGLREALARVEPDSPAAAAYRAAIERNERALANAEA